MTRHSWTKTIALVAFAVLLTAKATAADLIAPLPAEIHAKDVAKEAKSLRLAIEDLQKSFPTPYRGQDYLAKLEQIERALAEKSQGPWDPKSEAVRTMLTALRTLAREALVVGNPLLESGRIVFVKRFTYSPGWYYADFMRAERFGGNLCVLSLADGKVTELVPSLAGGIFDRFDLSFDGLRVVFGYKKAPGIGFRLYEVGIDGRGLRQLTFDPPDEAARVAKYWHPANKPSGVYRHHTDDFYPCYLPDGGICFTSTRCERSVLCDESDQLTVNTLYRMNADGSDIQELSGNALSESTPTVMNDGRILYTRWEYVDKGVIAEQMLWAMNPDGTGSTAVYGKYIDFPPVLIQGRAIPGSDNLFVCTATMHHPFAVGPILRVDTRRNPLTAEPLHSLTPDTDLSVEGKEGAPLGENFAHWQNGQLVKDNIGPLFADPYPLADPTTGAGAGKYFLVACNPNRAWNDPSAYGMWLIDEFGNRVPIYHDPGISSWQPIPLRPRPCPPVIASHLPKASASTPKEATVILSDIYAGLDGVPRGTVKYLRILEQVPRPWSARRFWPNDSTMGQHVPISLNAHIFVKVLHGIVPVQEDGSAYFTVPAGKSLFFQALDANYMEVQRMRSFVNFQPGESRSCHGCHLYQPTAVANQSPLALRNPLQKIVPQPGETGPRPIHYPTDVQPILDRHCVQCHNPKKSEGQLDLSGDRTTFFCRSYENIMNKHLVAYIQEFIGPQPHAQITNVKPLPAYQLGSHSSRFITLLRQGHYDVKLSPEEMIRLVTWADANGPYYGSYFGRRNLMYKDLPDFRPTPTLESAIGIPPKTPSP